MDVSIIIPVYEVEDYIERCILSVCNQIYKGITIECILVDDNSSDKSIEKAQNLINTYTGDIMFKIYRHNINLGLSSARNTGMKNATGKYIFFMDSDDDIDNLCIQKLWNVVLKHPNIQMVKGNYFDFHTVRKGIDELRIPQGIINNYQLLELFFLGILPVVAWNGLILREIVVNNNIFFKPGLIYEDVLWSFQLFCYIDRFFFFPEVTLNYENNPKSITSTQNGNRVLSSLNHVVIIEELLKKYCKDHGVSNILYLLSELLPVLDVIWKENKHIDNILITKTFGCRDLLFKLTLNNYRFILLLFELIMYKPFAYVIKLKMFRRNYQKIKGIIYKTAMLCDRFHHKNYVVC